MAMISMILSGLALLAAITSLALTVRNEKRSQKRKTDLVNYVDSSIGAFEKKIHAEVHDRLEKLEMGITPDYEQAKAAAAAVNDFNKGISNLLGFDPYESLRASRRKDGGDGE